MHDPHTKGKERPSHPHNNTPSHHTPSAYCDEDRYWSQYDIEHEPGAKDNLCDDDWVTDADDIFPGDVVEKRFGGGNYISGDIVQVC